MGIGGGGDRGEFVINVRDARFDIKPDTGRRRQFYQLTREHTLSIPRYKSRRAF